ncbi:MAG: hypothetical protein K1X71_01020 [Pirellulales bacterium]|nr:hypothetical protein [Pirellulales bacterium]
MLTVQVLEQALAALRQLGVEPRLEWLAGQGGGECEFGGRRWLFLDLGQSPSEQLDLALSCLETQTALAALELQAELALVLNRRKCATQEKLAAKK